MRDNEEIKRFQENLALIRKILGLSEKELGDQIGVTRQTISSIENQKTKMNRTQYLALRMVIADEMNKNSEDNKMLDFIMKAIVDETEPYTKAQKEKILEKAKLLAPAIITKSNTKKEVSKQFIEILTAIGIIAVAIIAGNGAKGGKK